MMFTDSRQSLKRKPITRHQRCHTGFPKRFLSGRLFRRPDLLIRQNFNKTKAASDNNQSLAAEKKWWRRGESNPCPEGRWCGHLHVQAQLAAFRVCVAMRRLSRIASCLWKSRTRRGNPALYQPVDWRRTF